MIYRSLRSISGAVGSRQLLSAGGLLLASGALATVLLSGGATPPPKGAGATGTAGNTSEAAGQNAQRRQAAQRPSTPEEMSDLSAAAVQSFDVTTSATGELEARKQIDIRNQLEQPTTIVEIVKEGVQVKAGDVVVRLNSEAIQSQVDEESIRVESSRAEAVAAESNYMIQVNQNASDLRKAQLDVELGELDFRKWLEGEVKSKQQANQLAFEKATRELDRLKEKYERSVELEKRGFLARDELRRDEVLYLEAQAALKTAQLDTRVYDEFEYVKDEKVKRSTVDQARAELEKVRQRAEGELAKADADRRNKREQFRLRDQKLEKLREQLDLAVLKAPGDGLVVYATSLNRDRWGGNSEGVLDVGRQVKRNEQLIVLPDTSEMVASVRVSESLMGRIRQGQTATIRVDALGGRSISGVVESIGVIAESGGWRDPNLREYTVKVRLDMAGIDVALKPSMRAEANILLDKVEGALTVPIQSVFSEGLVRYVLMPERKGRFVKQPVRVGRRSERFAEILVGVAEGERVLLREPVPGEVVDQPWDKAKLALVGLNLLPDGRVLPFAGAGRPAISGGPGGPSLPGGPGAPSGPGMGRAPAGATPGDSNAGSGGAAESGGAGRPSRQGAAPNAGPGAMPTTGVPIGGLNSGAR